jgi:epsilon-lactone hydrolase
MVSYIDKPLSFQAKLIYKIIGMLNLNGKMERKILENTYLKKAANIPHSFFRKYDVQTVSQNDRNIWEITRKSSDSEWIILYLHGGAYYANINTLHWRLIEQLILKTNAKVIVPDYPLSPESVCTEVYQFMDELYKRLINRYPDKRTAFMGDSAGGGIALGFAQKIKNEAIKQPVEIILFSPWLDVSMNNPDLIQFEKDDKILNVNALKIAGKNYAGSLEVSDYRVSPINGNFNDLARVTIFTGTRDILITDARKCALVCEEQNVRLYCFEYRDMFHDWVIIPGLKESQDVIHKVRTILNEQTSTEYPWHSGESG